MYYFLSLKVRMAVPKPFFWSIGWFVLLLVDVRYIFGPNWYLSIFDSSAFVSWRDMKSMSGIFFTIWFMTSLIGVFGICEFTLFFFLLCLNPLIFSEHIHIPSDNWFLVPLFSIFPSRFKAMSLLYCHKKFFIATEWKSDKKLIFSY